MDSFERISTPRGEHAPDFYLAYLNSPDWRRTRNRALKAAGWQCQRCPSKRDLQVHHKTYERLGAEWDTDLEVVCENCHRAHHLDDAETSGRLYLKIAREVVRGTPLAAFPDLMEDAKVLCATRRIPYDSEKIGRALGLVCGTRTEKVLAPEPVEESEWYQPLTKAEMRELWCRLEAGGIDLSSLIKTMPESTPRRVIDIYAPVPDDDRVDHDRY